LTVVTLENGDFSSPGSRSAFFRESRRWWPNFGSYARMSIPG